ncbi:MAG: DUF6328 family protein [Acidimicrobiales bacterium]
MSSVGDGVASGGRPATEAERHNRNLADLLQELRIAGLGVQVLFGFLLSLPFTARFVRLGRAQRHLYEADLLLAALAIALLVTPVAYHRFVFRLHDKKRLLVVANALAIAGLGTTALAISGSVVLVLTFVESGWVVPVLTSLLIALFVILWFVVPLRERQMARRGTDSP